MSPVVSKCNVAFKWYHMCSIEMLHLVTKVQLLKYLCSKINNLYSLILTFSGFQCVVKTVRKGQGKAIMNISLLQELF